MYVCVYIYIYIYIYTHIYVYPRAHARAEKEPRGLARQTVGRAPYFQHVVVFITQQLTTTGVPSFFCPRSRATSEVVVCRALGLYFT